MAELEEQRQNAVTQISVVHSRQNPNFREEWDESENNLWGVGRTQRTNQIQHSRLLYGHNIAERRSIRNPNQENMELHNLYL